LQDLLRISQALAKTALGTWQARAVNLRWQDPMGVTPVIAFRHGAVPEVIATTSGSMGI
jgi:hypothetical protein